MTDNADAVQRFRGIKFRESTKPLNNRENLPIRKKFPCKIKNTYSKNWLTFSQKKHSFKKSSCEVARTSHISHFTDEKNSNCCKRNSFSEFALTNNY